MTINLSTSADAKARGWGPGWPHDNRANVVPVRWSNGVQPVGGVHRSIATLVQLLGNETIRRGYHPHVGWCWGFEDRAIAGTQIASNHSWGLAVDINAPTNPYTSPLRTDMPAWMPQLWGLYGFRWGGHYSGPYDAMHYEFMGTPADAAERTLVARENLTHPVPVPVPTPTPIPLEDDDMLLLFVKDTDPDPKPAYADAGTAIRHVSPAELEGRDHAAGGPGRGHTYITLPGADPFFARPLVPTA